MQFVKFLALSALVLFLVGCAAPLAPVTLDSIALPSGAQLTSVESYIQARNAITDEIRNARGITIANLDSRIYTVPKDMQWDQIQSFFDRQLGSGAWRAADPGISNTDGSTYGKGWQRGRQVLTIFFIADADPRFPDALLLTALGTIQR